MLPLPIVLFFALFIHKFSVADPQGQLGFPCTNESSSSGQNYGCVVGGNVLRFFVVGDIGGEEYKTSGDGTVQGQPRCTVVEGEECPPTVVKHRPTEGQKAVAKAMDLLAKDGMAPHFLLNLGDNFYESGVTFADVAKRMKENFTNVYHYGSLNVPWYTIAGNNDWKSVDGIRPQIERPVGKWTFPAQHYVAHYTFGNGLTARFIMVDTTVLCGSGSSVFRKTQKANPSKYDKMVADAKQHITWLRKQLREAKRRVNFLFLAGHCPLHIVDALPNARMYPCARRMKALMRFFQVQAYFAGHAHNLKYVDLHGKEGGDGVSTKYIVSGAGSRMENAIDRDRFPEQYLPYVKFSYPKEVGQRANVDGEQSEARGALDGGAFVGVEIDAEKGVGKVNFYAAGMLYHGDGTKVPIEKWHRFGDELVLTPREIDESDENENICDEFLRLEVHLRDDEHFKRDAAEQMQFELGKYFCVNLRESEKMKMPKIGGLNFDGTSFETISSANLDQNSLLEVYAKETFAAIRKECEISYRKLADSFLSDDLLTNANNADRSTEYYLTSDRKFVVEEISENKIKEIVGQKASAEDIYLAFSVYNNQRNRKHFLLKKAANL